MLNYNNKTLPNFRATIFVIKCIYVLNIYVLNIYVYIIYNVYSR